jgi:hypothetical protein
MSKYNLLFLGVELGIASLIMWNFAIRNGYYIGNTETFPLLSAWIGAILLVACVFFIDIGIEWRDGNAKFRKKEAPRP